MFASDPPDRTHAMWISWNFHRRTTGLCAAWCVPLYIIHAERQGIMRWIERAVKTLELLRRHRPEILIVQNPSLALTVLASIVRRRFGYCLVVDAHNEGVRPFDRPYAWVRWLTRRLLKAADVTIVTNAALAVDVLAAGGRPLVLTDALPVPSPLPTSRRQKADMPDVAVVATFRPDEPIAAIMTAAGAMPDIRFAFSGDTARFQSEPLGLPSNVRLTGYLLDAAYWRLLAQAKVVCDLTLKPDCLVCGAYEALSLGKPMVLSDNLATREVFGAAAVLTGSEPLKITDALRSALANCEGLAIRAGEIRDVYHANWLPRAAKVWDAIQAQCTNADRGVS